ncbi:MAG: hypothetical protein JWL97_328 [Gemmatimonadales bacterium]|nr:hypothetical protein [Gemmatimonadales bacterium]
MKRSICILTAALLFRATPSQGQQVRRGGEVKPSEEIVRELRQKEPEYADPATRRLEILTEIWGNVGLYHPVPSAMHLKWDDVLVEALRSMPQVHSDRDLVDVLNRVVFAPLHDPLVYATIRSTDSPSSVVPPLESRWLDSSTAYLRAADDLGLMRFAERVRAAVDSLLNQRTPARLVIDLRTPIRGAYFLSAPWLGMWTREPIARASDLSILRTTELGLGNGTWLVTPWDSLQTIAPVIAVPTVFFVNRKTYPTVERSIDALRAHRKDVAVVFEQTGEVPIMWDEEHFPQVWYPDSILLSSTRLPFISADGALGSVVDVNSTSAIPMSNVAGVAARALAVRAVEQARKPFVLAAPRILDDTVSLAPLTREQRLAGVLKTWFWVLHFYAYVDDISGNWRHVLASLVPQVEAAQSDSAYYRILQRMIGRLNDTHAGVQHPLADGLGSPGFAYSVPLTFRWVERRLAVFRVDTAQAAIGIAPGDEVLAVDGRPVADVAAEIRPYWSISWPDAPVPPFFLNGPRNSTLRLRVRSASGVHEVSLPRSRRFAFRDSAPLFPHPAYAILPGNIGFIDLGQVTSPGALDSAMSALANTRGMLLDDRSAAAYGAQHVVYRFIRDPMPCMRRAESISYLGYPVFPMQALGATQCWSVPLVSRNTPTYTKPLVVMIGRDDISYGESLAQKLRIARRATLVGEATGGTFGWRDGITLPGGAVVYFTRGRALWPNGEKYHGIGVVPDVPTHPTLLGVRHGRDEVYETALATLRRLVNK